MIGGLPFREIVCLDFEFIAEPGENPVPVCLVAKEMVSGRLIRLWQDQLGPEPPFATDKGVLFVAFVAQAELECFIQLGWPLPTRVLDLFAEFKIIRNGLPSVAGKGLLGAMSWYCIPGITKEEKKSNRDLILRGGPWDSSEKQEILDYCQSDVDALPPLLAAMVPTITATPQGLGQALLRGRYTCAVAHMQHNGIPIDTVTLSALQGAWDYIKTQLIDDVDAQYGVYDDGHFRDGLFARYLFDQGISWPRTETGLLKTDEDTFRDMTKVYPQLEPLKDLRHALGQMRLSDIAVGRDGRNRTLLWPFSARTGRNAPSSTGYIFGPAVWLRGLIKPELGRAVAYMDYSAQEIAIAAALSGDHFLAESIATGDPYMHFAISAGMAPVGADKDTHPDVRTLCKQTLLGTQYGMGARTLAFRTKKKMVEAEALLEMLTRTYPIFAKWREDTVDTAMLRGYIATNYGWRLNVTAGTKPTALKNFPMQSHGAEMLRIACCLAVERGVKVIAPVHDAIMIEAPCELIDDAIATAKGAMAEAAAKVIGPSVWLDVDVHVTSYPDRYRDKDGRGKVMWERVISLLEGLDKPSGVSELSKVSI